MRYLLLIIFVSTVLSLNAQNKSDYSWMLGYNISNEMDGGEGNLINFSTSPPSITSQQFFPEQALGNSVSLMSDKYSGELLFYSNGCVIYDKTHNLMKNGDNINPGKIRDYYCEETDTKWYPNSMGTMALPDPSNENGYYLLHQPIRDEGNELSIRDTMRYTYIDMSENEERGEVIMKNEVFYSTRIERGITANKHANGKDWWIVLKRDDLNEFAILLLDENGISLRESQKIGDSIIIKKAFQASFSPDGTKYAFYNGEVGLNLYDFNRETGTLSNHRQCIVTDTLDHGGLAFSSNGRFVYCITATGIFQVDLLDEDMCASSTRVATLQLPPPPYGVTFQTTFFYAVLGPDCRIYITARNGVKWLTTIDYPNEKGVDCHVSQYTFELPNSNFISAIPNLPHYRIDEAQPCDPGISSIATMLESRFFVYPNPTAGEFKVRCQSKGSVTITNGMGNTLIEREIGNEESINISHLATGVYFITFWKDGKKWETKKIIKL